MNQILTPATEMYNPKPVQVDAWERATDEEYIVWEDDIHNQYHYSSTRQDVREIWFKHLWRITLGNETFEGELASAEPYLGHDGSPNLEFEVMIASPYKERPIYIAAHYSLFTMLDDLSVNEAP